MVVVGFKANQLNRSVSTPSLTSQVEIKLKNHHTAAGARDCRTDLVWIIGETNHKNDSKQNWKYELE